MNTNSSYARPLGLISSTQSNSDQFDTLVAPQKHQEFFKPVNLSQENFSSLCSVIRDPEILAESFEDLILDKLFQPQIASILLTAFNRDLDIFSDKNSRVKILNSLRPHADDLLVQVYSVNSIVSEIESVSLEVVEAALSNLSHARELHSKITNSLITFLDDPMFLDCIEGFEREDASEEYLEEEDDLILIDEILESSSISRPVRTAVYNSFQAILRHSPLSDCQLRDVEARAYSFYRETNFADNPWVKILSAHDNDLYVRCLKNIAGGKLRSDEPNIRRDAARLLKQVGESTHISGAAVGAAASYYRCNPGLGSLFLATAGMSAFIGTIRFANEIKCDAFMLSEKRTAAIAHAQRLLEEQKNTDLF